jgi:hypothetical protein
MKLTRFTTVGMAVLALCFVLWLILLLVGTGGNRTGPAVRVDDKHCPNCGRELPLTARTAEDCPFCKLDTSADGAGRKRSSVGIAGTSFTVPAVLLAFFVLLLGVHLWVALQRKAANYKDETLYLTSCANCTRKLRYRPQQIGRAALCPLCRRLIVFPEPDEAPRRRLWQRIIQW